MTMHWAAAAAPVFANEDTRRTANDLDQPNLKTVVKT
jgi:hypothetical protein